MEESNASRSRASQPRRGATSGREPRGSISASTRSLEFERFAPATRRNREPRVCCATARTRALLPRAPLRPLARAPCVARRRQFQDARGLEPRRRCERRPAGRRISARARIPREGVRRHHLPVHPPRGRSCASSTGSSRLASDRRGPTTPPRALPDSRLPVRRAASTPRATARVLPSVRGFRLIPPNRPRRAPELSTRRPRPPSGCNTSSSAPPCLLLDDVGHTAYMAQMNPLVRPVLNGTTSWAAASDVSDVPFSRD